MITWDQLFMSMVFLVSMKSKDKNTHIGAVIVGPNNEVRSVGYNSFPRWLDDTKKERQEKPEKYFWFEHAERNAIYNATLMGVSLNDCRMYTNGVPCMDCARGVIQSGITEVIFHEKWYNDNEPKWKESCSKAYEMLTEAGIRVRAYKKPILRIIPWRDSGVYDIDKEPVPAATVSSLWE